MTKGAAAVDDLATWIDAYRAACANRDQWSDIADRAKQQITQHLDRADAEVGTIAGRPVVRYTTVITKRLDQKALKAKEPELAEQYSVISTSRRFSIVEQDGAP